MPEDTNRSGVLLFSESPEVCGELLAVGRELAGRMHAPVTVAALGSNVKQLLEESLAYGADEVIVVQPRDGAVADAESTVPGLCEIIRVTNPSVLLIGGTRAGADIAARVSQTLRVPCASNCIALQLDDHQNLRIERRIYGGRFVARQLLSVAPRVATVQPKRFARPDKTEVHGRIREIAVDVPPSTLKTVSMSQRSRSQVDVTKAEIIVSAGRGLKKMEDLQMLEKLAQLLGGVLAGSRPLTGDMDWMSVDRRIGLSGQTVKPNLYLACGISGQIEHIVGMKGARTVVAINNDPKAPIHGESDYSIIGDLYEIVPALIRACEGKISKMA
jgi:electron transfer flavoprotein alpha subunit